jgi:uncharacterized protein (DUF486 family)
MEGKMESDMQQHNDHIKVRSGKPIVKALLVCWSIIYFSYALLGVWLGTGEYALAGPRTSLSDYIASAVWLGLSVLQLLVTVTLVRHPKRWLWWAAIVFAVVSVGTVIGPPLLAPLFSK